MTENTWERLRSERERLHLTQQQLADAIGISRVSQGNYENGSRNPDMAYLSAIAGAGADVQYILTGRRSLNWPVGEAVTAERVNKNDLLDTLELIRRESEKGLELVKKLA
jgi:transcriptional regulator with XRE-family HTH domain